MLVEFDNEKELGSFHFYVGWLSVGWINKPGFFSSSSAVWFSWSSCMLDRCIC